MVEPGAEESAREISTDSWGAERPWHKVTGLQPASLREPLRSPEHIRLLLLDPPKERIRSHPGSTRQASGPITSRVFQIRLDKLSTTGRPLFAALSYCWGSEAKTRKINCNNLRVKVTENAYHALYWIRLSTRPRLVWIDCLCIDQSNLAEKSQQVSRMGSIYRESHVVSYVGGNTDPEHAEPAMAVIRRLASISHCLDDTRYTVDDWLRLSRTIYNTDRPNSTPDWERAPWASVAGLLCEPYFGRLWAFQEIHLARSHVCQWALHSCSIYQLNEACRILSLEGGMRNSRDDFDAACARVQSMSRDPLVFVRNNDVVHSDYALVSRCEVFGCKDPRDRVFGLTSLFAPNGYNVDYSLDVVAVYTEFVVHLLATDFRNGWRCIFSGHAHRSAYRDPDSFAMGEGWTWSSKLLPSWCPDLGLGDEAGLPMSYLLRVLGGPQAGPNRRLMSRILPVSERIISVRGVQCATITRCTDQERSDKDSVEFLLKAANLALRLRGHLEAGEISVGFLDTLRGGWHVYDEDGLFVYRDSSGPRCYRRILLEYGRYYYATHIPTLAILGGDEGPISSHTPEQIDHFIRDTERVVETRWRSPCRAFVTAPECPLGARFGIGPDGLRVGDKIFVAYGVHNPLVLREVGNQGRFKYIGNCQLHGLMEGEALGLGVKTEQVELI